MIVGTVDEVDDKDDDDDDDENNVSVSIHGSIHINEDRHVSIRSLLYPIKTSNDALLMCNSSSRVLTSSSKHGCNRGSLMCTFFWSPDIVGVDDDDDDNDDNDDSADEKSGTGGTCRCRLVCVSSMMTEDEEDEDDDEEDSVMDGSARYKAWEVHVGHVSEAGPLQSCIAQYNPSG